MKYFNILITIFIILFLLLPAQSIIKNIFFLSGSNLLTFADGQRDGIVIATLDTNENTTICNYNFDERSASVVCKTLGFPAQGISMIDNRMMYGGDVLLANVQCDGTEANLSFCVSSGRSVQRGPCATHTTDVHVYCTQQKIGPVIVPNSVVTACNLTTNDFNLTLKGNRVNSGLIQAKYSATFYYVCNDDYSFTPEYARIICGALCTNPTLTNVIMPYFNVTLLTADTNQSVRITCNSAMCFSSAPITCLRKSYLIGLQCGEEPQVIEQPPNVTCTSKNMTVTWNTGFLPQIRPDLVSLASNPGCASTSGNNTFAVLMSLSFDNCLPTVNGDQNNINFSYILNRNYEPDGLATSAPKTLTVKCVFPKSGNNTDGFLISVSANNLLNTTLVLFRRMEFYTDTSYSNQIIPPGVVDSDKKVYVKVYVANPSKNITLVLVDCWATTSANSTSFDSTNSVSLIASSCPTPNVVMSSYNRTEIRFSFTPFKIANSTNQQFYVACSTYICISSPDSYCPYCARRKKRSINLKHDAKYLVQKSLYFRSPSEKIFDQSN